MSPLESLIRFFVQRHMLVNVILAGLVFGGLVTASRTAREGFPSVSMPRLTIVAQLPGASARDVETKITLPLEEAIQEVDNVDSYYSVANDNQSVTTVELYEDLSEDLIRQAVQDVRTEIDGISDFPDEMTDEPVITRLNPAKFPVIEIALSGPEQALPSTARLLERAIRRIDEVAEVGLVGLRDPEVRIYVDPERAREHGITLLEVVSAIERRNISSTGGILETETARRQVVLWSRFENPEEVASTVLRFDPGGGALRVSDVARVEVGREDTGLLAHTNAEAGISLVVQKRVQADILTAADRVVEVVENTPLPAGVEVRFVRDESFLTRNRLDLMATNGMIGIVLVAIIVFTFLSPGAAIWVLVGVPVVFLSVLLVMPRIGMTVNLLATGGFVVVLGMLVDDAVVVAERILRRRQQGLPPDEAAVQGTLSVARPVAASAITTVLAFSPMFAIGGMPGKIIWNIPAVVILCLIFSLLESFFILPSHMSLAKRDAAPQPKRRFVLRLEEHYRAALEKLLPRRGAIVGVFVAIFIFTMVVIRPLLGFVLFPQDDSDALHVRVSTALGTPIEQTEGVVASIESQIPLIVGADLLAVTARIGHQDALAVEREHGAAENEAVISIHLHPKGLENTAAEWAEVLKHSLRVPLNTTLVYEVETLGPPIGRPIEIHVASNDDATRRSTATSIARYLEDHAAVVDVDLDERPGTPQVDLNLDYEKLALRGLDAEDVGLTLKAAFFGLEASELRDLDDTTTYRVLFDPSARRSLDALLETPIRNARGELVLLRDVVSPIDLPAVSRIYHREGIRTATVTAAILPISGETSASMAAAFEADLLPRFAGRTDVEVYLGGEIVETRKTTGDLALVAAMAFAAIAVVIALMLGSFIEAFFVVSVVPFALVGVLITFFLHGKDLSMLAMIGTIGLAGVVVNASIVMVDSVHQRLAEIGEVDSATRNAAIIDALVARLRPILVTSLSTFFGVIPTAYGLGGYDAMLSPMSLALGWGLAFSTLITLFLVPALYTIAGDLRRAIASRRQGLEGRIEARLERETTPRH